MVKEGMGIHTLYTAYILLHIPYIRIYLKKNVYNTPSQRAAMLAGLGADSRIVHDHLHSSTHQSIHYVDYMYHLCILAAA